jgi:hypothetical protein
LNVGQSKSRLGLKAAVLGSTLLMLVEKVKMVLLRLKPLLNPQLTLAPRYTVCEPIGGVSRAQSHVKLREVKMRCRKVRFRCERGIAKAIHEERRTGINIYLKLKFLKSAPLFE